MERCLLLRLKSQKLISYGLALLVFTIVSGRFCTPSKILSFLQGVGTGLGLLFVIIVLLKRNK